MENHPFTNTHTSFNQYFTSKRNILQTIIISLCLYLIYFIYCDEELFSHKQTEIKFHIMHRIQFRGFDPKKLKYILLWTPVETEPFYNLGKGQQVFLKNNCTFSNCFVTSNKTLLKTISKYDVVAFNAPDLNHTWNNNPRERLRDQMYLYVANEAAHYNQPICLDEFKYFFNVSWKYKLTSDLKYQHIVVRNKTGFVIGPKRWLDVKDMEPIKYDIRKMLLLKSKAVAWFVPNCSRSSNKVKILESNENVSVSLNKLGFDADISGKVNDLKISLNKIGYGLDIYVKCPAESVLVEMINKDYFFYFVIENSLDRVTENFVHGLNTYYAVPIVFGSGNFKRFIPEGIFIDGEIMAVPRIIREVFRLISFRERYYDMFRWHSHYYLDHNLPEINAPCRLCAMVNSWVMTKMEYPDFLHGWNEPDCDKRSALMLDLYG